MCQCLTCPYQRAQVINIVISAIKDNLSDARNWSGVGIVCLSVGAYCYAGQLAKRGNPKPDEEAAGKAASELSPLTPSDELTIFYASQKGHGKRFAEDQSQRAENSAWCGGEPQRTVPPGRSGAAPCERPSR